MHFHKLKRLTCFMQPSVMKRLQPSQLQYIFSIFFLARAKMSFNFNHLIISNNCLLVGQWNPKWKKSVAVLQKSNKSQVEVLLFWQEKKCTWRIHFSHSPFYNWNKTESSKLHALIQCRMCWDKSDLLQLQLVTRWNQMIFVYLSCTTELVQGY